MRWRRLVQVLVLAAFVFLFLKTEYTDTDQLPYAVNIFLRFDPLVAASSVIAGRSLISLVWPALITVGLTIVLGRFFCGWICPLGTILDGVDRAVYRRGRRERGIPPALRAAKYLVLAFILGSALMTLQWAFLFDPLSILIRSLSVAVYPAVNLAVNATFGSLYETGWKPVTFFSEPVYAFLREHFLAFEQPYFRLATLTGLIFLGILGLEWLGRRFWCRYLCPLGAMFGLLGRLGLFRRRVTEPDCIGCGVCRNRCRMAAISADYLGTDERECIKCRECAAVCPREAVRFSGKAAHRDEDVVEVSRRSLVRALGAGLVLPPLVLSDARRKAPPPGLIRPPGALPEPAFLARCTRCGECMRVCLANGLHPTLLEGGLPALFSPILVSRLGYCEYNCTLCGQVCPTGAIRHLLPAEKKKVRIGLAEVDRSHCLPWKGESPCIVCEEHCPTGDKAIKLRLEKVVGTDGRERELQVPFIDERLCIGCGVCENKCPLADRSAIVVTSRGESRRDETAMS